MSKRFAYDYFDVDVPDDVGDADERHRVAFLMAEEMSQIYAIPCVWYIVSDDGNTVRVGRKRNRRTE
jgi:hypothetical protein